VHGSVDDRLVGFHGLTQRTATLANIGFQNILAPSPNGLLPPNTGDLFGGAIERRDAPRVVDSEDTVGDAIEDDVTTIV
jgi:hypothetical protein